MNLRFLFGRSVPDRSPLSVRIWKPLHTPRIATPLLALFLTSEIILEVLVFGRGEARGW